MKSSLSDQARGALEKLAGFQNSIIGNPGLIKTEYLCPDEVPEIGLNWACYIFRCTWSNGWVTVSAIDRDEEHLVVYVLADRRSLGDPCPEPTGESYEDRDQPCLPYDFLFAELAHRLGQIGLPEIKSAKHVDQFRDYPVNLSEGEILVYTSFRDSDIEGYASIFKSGKKAVVYLYEGDGVKLDPAQVRNSDLVNSENLPERGQMLADFKALFGY